MGDTYGAILGKLSIAAAEKDQIKHYKRTPNDEYQC